jgi:hypothetical protein
MVVPLQLIVKRSKKRIPALPWQDVLGFLIAEILELIVLPLPPLVFV